jgi:hypothetical protein
MQGTDQIKAWNEVANELNLLLTESAKSPLQERFEAVARKAEIENPWFTRKQIDTAISGIVKLLEPVKLEEWASKYSLKPTSQKTVGVIMPGNIPLAGFHDFLCVLLSGHKLHAKLSSSDKILLPFIADLFCEKIPSMKSNIEFRDQLKSIDAVIATGSNNTGRYFEYYFGKLPHIFRKNRNSAAIITGKENEFDFVLIGRDIFTYFGLGCRNVSKLYVPEGYKFDDFFAAMMTYSDVLEHNKYMNNHDYHQALYLLNQDYFLTNNFLIIIENNSLSSPVGVLHYETYVDEADLDQKLQDAKNDLQCVVRKGGSIPPGQAQFPAIDDYADGVDTMLFLTKL